MVASVDLPSPWVQGSDGERRGNENGEPGDPDSPRKIFPGPDRGLFGLREFGLGNLVAAHREPDSPKAEGLLVRFTFTRGTNGRWSATKGEYAPLLVTDTLPVRVLDVTHALATHPTARLRLAQRLSS